MTASMRSAVIVCLIAFGGLAALGWSANTARAQSSACIAECQAFGWGFSQCNRYCARRFGEPNYSKGPRVYGYAPVDAGGGSCGEYKYFRNGRCVDARVNPPK